MTASGGSTIPRIASGRRSSPGRQTVRVSCRELAEATKWAFVAAGCSAGEASIAGWIVQRAEVDHGCGVDAALNELLTARFSSASIKRSGGPVDVIADDHGRGLLTLAPLAVALAAARVPNQGGVILTGAGWHPVIASVLVGVLHRWCPGVAAVAAWPMDGDGPDEALNRGVLAVAGSERAEPLDPSLVAPLLAAFDAERPGRDAMAIASVIPAAETKRLAEVRRIPPEGVHVDGPTWSRLCDAAKRFLVVDA